MEGGVAEVVGGVDVGPEVDELFDDGDLVEDGGFVEGGHAGVVGLADVASGVSEADDDVEDAPRDCPVEAGVALLVGGVGVGAGVYELGDASLHGGVARVVEGGHASEALGVDFGSLFDQIRNDFEVSVSAGPDQGCGAPVGSSQRRGREGAEERRRQASS